MSDIDRTKIACTMRDQEYMNAAGVRTMEKADMDRYYGTQRSPVKSWDCAPACVVLCLAISILLCGVARVEAQFNSGSSGIHGVFPPVPETGAVPASYAYLVWNVRTGGVRYCSAYTIGTGSDACNTGASVDTFAQIPNIPSGGLTTGVYEFSDVTMSAVNGQNREIVLVGYSANTPISILSQTDIEILGSPGGNTMRLRVHGWAPPNTSSNFSDAGGRGGPGGFNGAASGNGGSQASDGASGFGPSGGAGGRADATVVEALNAASASASPLNPSLTPLTGGSGGGGAAGVGPDSTLGCGSGALGYAGGAGGGGGGALLLAASGRITLAGSTFIDASGGNGARNTSSGCGLFGGGGSGGSVRIVGQEFTGSGTIIVSGGTRQSGGNPAPGGHVRIEAALSTYNGAINGASGGSFLSFPTAAVPANQPVLRITSIAGQAAPTNPAAALAAPDINFSTAIDAPVTVAVGASNVPTGTPVDIRVVPAVGAPTTATSSGLVGTLSNSTAAATVVLPPGAGIVTASATFSVTGGTAGPLALRSVPLIDGKRPERVEVALMADGTSRTFLLAESGARFEMGQTR